MFDWSFNFDVQFLNQIEIVNYNANKNIIGNTVDVVKVTLTETNFLQNLHHTVFIASILMTVSLHFSKEAVATKVVYSYRI